ncbi:S8 family serine peptidase, partial [Bacillus cereus]|nr:S8 family serine peptidase [Bacillus cereus]
STGTTAQVIDGIEHAVKDKMDVINLSLGSDAEKDVNSPDAFAINNGVMSGIVAVVASGNAGPGLGTMGAPATSQLAISVG